MTRVSCPVTNLFDFSPWIMQNFIFSLVLIHSNAAIDESSTNMHQGGPIFIVNNSSSVFCNLNRLVKMETHKTAFLVLPDIAFCLFYFGLNECGWTEV